MKRIAFERGAFEDFVSWEDIQAAIECLSHNGLLKREFVWVGGERAESIGEDEVARRLSKARSELGAMQDWKAWARHVQVRCRPAHG
jgi:hypothetical protein